MGMVYYAAWSGTADHATWVAAAVLVVEGVSVLASRGDCPITPLLRRLGDETPLFELVLPPRAAALAVPVLGTVTALGFLLLVIRVL